MQLKHLLASARAVRRDGRAGYNGGREQHMDGSTLIVVKSTLALCQADVCEGRAPLVFPLQPCASSNSPKAYCVGNGHRALERSTGQHRCTR
jgi:hypothetical protein